MTSVLSVFRPVTDSFFEIIPSFEVVHQSPAPAEEEVKERSEDKSPKKNNVKKTKIKWTDEKKNLAIRTAKEIGLTKATRLLKSKYPKEFKNLSPSTVQYWLAKDKIDSIN